MPRAKFDVGEQVEVRCDHMRDGRRVNDWLAGRVVQVDQRMAAVQLESEASVVFSSNGWPIPDRILWCAHGSRNIRRRQRDSTA